MSDGVATRDGADKDQRPADAPLAGAVTAADRDPWPAREITGEIPEILVLASVAGAAAPFAATRRAGGKAPPAAGHRGVHVVPRGEIPATIPARARPALLTTAEAAEFLRYRTASGIRTAVARGLLVPFGSGPRGTHLFTEEELVRFVRGARYADPRLETRGDKDDVDAPARAEDSLPRRVSSERQQLPRARRRDRPAHRQEEGGGEALRRGERPAGRAAADGPDRGDRRGDARRDQAARFGLREIVDRIKGRQRRRGDG